MLSLSLLQSSGCLRAAQDNKGITLVLKYQAQGYKFPPLTRIGPVDVVVDPVHGEPVSSHDGALLGDDGQVGVAGVYRGPKY